MNKVFLKGRITHTPQLKQSRNGFPVTKFSVAVNRRFDKEKTDFVNCEAWKGTAEFICKYFTRGKEIALVGELHIDKSEVNGETKYYTSVVVDEVEFCGSKSDSIETKEEPSSKTEDAVSGFEPAPDIEDDDLPF